ncbi:MAG: class I SAM-dependent methyltransferase [Promethearchaeati archaeon]
MNYIKASLWFADAYRKFNRFEKFLEKDSKILDIGVGPGTLSYLLKCKGFNITSIDIQNLSLFKEIKTIIYDGKIMPFYDNSFDLGLISTVLHHTHDPEEILKEGKRVSKRLIIIEDIYDNKFQKFMTCVIDSISNFQIFNHPHTNKTHSDWLSLFNKLNLKIIYWQIDRVMPFLRQATYILEK